MILTTHLWALLVDEEALALIDIATTDAVVGTFELLDLPTIDVVEL